MKLKCFLLVDIFANCVLGLIFRPKKRGGGGAFSKGSFLKRRSHILLSIAYLCQSGTPELPMQSRTQNLLTSYGACSTKTKGSGKDWEPSVELPDTFHFIRNQYLRNGHCSECVPLIF